MSARKRGNNKRQPRTTGPGSKCISIMPDGTARHFKPKHKETRLGTIIQLSDGTWIRAIKERELL